MRENRRGRASYAAIAVAAALAGAAAFAGGSALCADDEDDAEADSAEAARIAKEALDKAVARGNALFHSKDLGKKSCASCHENPDKPNLDLKTRAFGYPAYSRRRKAVVSLDQKINEMMKFNARGPLFDPDSTDVAALGAYVMSLRKSN